MKLENTDSPHHEFHVHQALIDELCHPLCDELHEYWKVFDGETVRRFVQYLYREDCDLMAQIPAGTTTPTGTVSDGPELPLAALDFALGLDDAIGPVRETQNPVRPLTPLGGLKIPKLHVSSKRAPPVRPMTPTNPRYEAVLLAHAKLYILSYSQGIHELSDLCISRLRSELDGISPPPAPPADTQVLENIVKLLRYVYRSPHDDVAAPEPLQPAWAGLQNLVSQFCALNIDLMEGNKEFMELLGEAGPLAADVMAKTVRRLRSAEAALARANRLAEAALVEDKVAGYLLDQPRQRTPLLENPEQPHSEQSRQRTPQLEGVEKPYVDHWQSHRRTPRLGDLEQLCSEQPRQRTPHLEILEHPRRRTPHTENLEQPYLEHPRQRTPQLENLEKPYLQHPRPRRRATQLENLEQSCLEHPRRRTRRLEFLEQPRRLAITITHGSGDVTSAYETVPEDEGEYSDEDGGEYSDEDGGEYSDEDGGEYSDEDGGEYSVEGEDEYSMEGDGVLLPGEFGATLAANTPRREVSFRHSWSGNRWMNEAPSPRRTVFRVAVPV